MPTRSFRKAWPDQSIFPDEQDPEDYRLRRPKTVNAKLRQYAGKVVEQLDPQGQLENLPMNHPVIVQLAVQVYPPFDLHHPLLMDDAIEVHLEWLSTLTQDETEHPLVRQLGVQRQNLYFGWLAAQQQAAAEAEAEQAGAQEEQKAAGKARGTPADEESQPKNEPGGTTTSETVKRAADKVPALTQQARG
jgi:hypothetical protein